jgi:hypothetical protein
MKRGRARRPIPERDQLPRRKQMIRNRPHRKNRFLPRIILLPCNAFSNAVKWWSKDRYGRLFAHGDQAHFGGCFNAGSMVRGVSGLLVVAGGSSES